MPPPTASMPSCAPAPPPGSRAASSAARPTSTPSPSWAPPATRDRPPPPRDPARGRVLLAQRAVRLADPRTRHPLALHRRAEVHALRPLDRRVGYRVRAPPFGEL